MKNSHDLFLLAAYGIFIAALCWDYLAPRISYKKTLRAIVLKSLRKASKP
jgi:hypothetical protein